EKEVTTATSSSMSTITKAALAAIAVSLCINLPPVDAVDAPIPVKNLGNTGWDFIVNNKLVTGTLALLAYAIFACGKTYLQKPGAGLIAAAAAEADVAAAAEADVAAVLNAAIQTVVALAAATPLSQERR